jgi:GT2 family glycosyltransferase
VNKAAVSIVVPCYNSAATLCDTLESVINQVYADWEVIVVDDGSRDDSLRVILTYVSKDKRIRHVTQANQGLGAARNAGLRLATGEFVIFLDADDVLLPEMIERTLARAKHSDAPDLVHCGWICTDATMRNVSWTVPGCAASDYFAKLAHGNLFPCHAVLLRRSVLEESGEFDTGLRHCHDWDLWVRVARTGARFSCLSQPLVVYRLMQESLSHRARSFYEAGCEVIRRSHSPDSRVKHPKRRMRAGCSCAFQASLLPWCLQCASILVAQGKPAEAARLVSEFEIENSVLMRPEETRLLVNSLWFASATRRGDSVGLWKRTGDSLLEFLLQMETARGKDGFASQCLQHMWTPSRPHLAEVNGRVLVGELLRRSRQRLLREAL